MTLEKARIVTFTHLGVPFFAVASTWPFDSISAMAGQVIDRLADATGLEFDYQVKERPFISASDRISDIVDAAAEAWVAAKIPVQNKPPAPKPIVITPENSEFHLTRRGHELMNANMLAALKLARVVCEDAYEDAKVMEGCGKTPEAIQSTAAALAAWEAVSAAIDAAESVGIRAQSFAERERDLLEANNRYLEEARAARRELAARNKAGA